MFLQKVKMLDPISKFQEGKVISKQFILKSYKQLIAQNNSKY